jgi:lipoprotein signal peptidase
MTAVLVGLVLVPVLDQAVKAVVAERLGARSIPLGRLGEIRVVRAPIWMTRGPRGRSLAGMWAIWLVAAASTGLVCMLVPSAAWAGGAVLGASLSHAIEMSRRGAVRDYVCLTFWPAFNLADVALTFGGVSLALELSRALN